MIAPLLGWAALALTVAGTAASVYYGQESANANKKAAKHKQQLAEFENRRSRMKAAREARAKRASILAAGEAVGAGSTSGVAGATSGLQSQIGDVMGAQTSRVDASRAIAKDQNRAITASNNAGTAGAIGGMGGTIFQNFYGGFTQLAKDNPTIFGK